MHRMEECNRTKNNKVRIKTLTKYVYSRELYRELKLNSGVDIR
jgi:hypothetical protein